MNQNSVTNELVDQYARAVVPGLAKYAQLRETLSAAIRGGHWKPGSQLPPERELARLTRFSLGTVQRALHGAKAEPCEARQLTLRRQLAAGFPVAAADGRG